MLNKRHWLFLLVLIAAALRFQGLFANSFHADEALFASWARLIGVWRDPLLQTQVVDKPPLLFYLQALFYPLLATPAPWVARLPGLLASLLLVPLTGRLVWELYRDTLATVAATAFVALSPFTIQFSATAFTDPLLVTLLVSALVCQVAGTGDPGSRIGGRLLPTSYSLIPTSGLLFGLAVATKHQAWLFLPLLLGLGWLGGWGWAPWRRWLAGLVLPLLTLLAWDLARSGTFTLWNAQLESYGGVRLAWSWELWPRLAAWGELWRVLFGSPVLLFLLLLALPPFLALLIYHQDWPTAYDQLFVLFLLAYGALHWFLAVPVWDRYLLPVVPILALVLGRFLSRLVAFLGPEVPRPARSLLAPALLGSLVLMHLPGAWSARSGGFPVGGRPGAHGGAAEVAAFLEDSPYGTVLYDHWYNWQWRYYLFDTGVYVNWFAHPAGLAEDLRVFGETAGERYLVLPDAPLARPVLRAVVAAGYEAQPLFTAGEMVLYVLRGEAEAMPDG